MDEYEAYSASTTEHLVQRRTPGVSTEALIDKMMAIGAVITGSAPYPYQVPFIRRIFETILEREAEEITALWCRQGGKSQSLGFAASTLLVILPFLSEQFPDDDRLNFYDTASQTYRSYKTGFWIGIFAPKKEQAGIIFGRIRVFLQRAETVALLQELGVSYQTNNGDTFRLTSGSFVKCSTASDQANIEGQTLHLAILEESQDISDEKANKSIGPMLAAVGGSLVKIGTANARKSHFYNALRRNERRQSMGGVRNSFTVEWEEAAKYNTFYAKFVRKEMMRLGETSDEFQQSYQCRFMLERGLAVSEKMFWNRSVTSGRFSDVLPAPRYGMHYVAGIDFGKMHDSTVVTIVEVNWDTPASVIDGYDEEKGSFTVELFGKHIVAWLELLGDDYEAQYLEIQRFLRGWNIRRISLDYTGVGTALGDRFKAMFDSVDVDFVTYSDDSKDVLGRMFLADLHNGLLTWPAGEECQDRTEFKKFKTQMLDMEKDYRNGLLNLHHPDMRGAHDDYCQSACLAVRAASERPFGGEIEESEGAGWRR